MVRVDYRRINAVQTIPAWAPLVHEIFGKADTKAHAEPSFRGEIARSAFGSLNFSTVLSSNESVNRTAKHIAGDQRHMYCLVAVKSGSVSLMQSRRECVISSGQFVLLDCDAPGGWSHQQPTEVFNVIVPKHLLDSQIRNLQTHLAKPFSSRSGTWKIVWGFLETLNGQLKHISELAAYRYSHNIIDMVSLALETGEEDVPMFSSGIRLPLYRRCAAFIRANLSDPDLNPSKVAEAMGISVRYLHRIFQESDDSVCNYVKNARLDASRDALGNPSRRNESIAEIAFRHGFSSQSYFATAFKERFGMSARQWRRDAALLLKFPQGLQITADEDGRMLQ